MKNVSIKINVYLREGQYVDNIELGEGTEEEFKTFCAKFNNFAGGETFWVLDKDGTYYTFNTNEIQYMVIQREADK